MSIEITVSVTIANDDERWVNVARIESVQPARYDHPSDIERVVEAIDLSRARLTTLAGEVVTEAERQATQMRDTIGRSA